MFYFYNNSIDEILQLNSKKHTITENPISSSPISQSVELQESQNEKCIGVWVSYIDLDISTEPNTEIAFKNKFDSIVEKSKEFNVNNIFVHIRSHCDALYPSDIFPWSHILTGIQGKNPGFDPLSYMIDLCHKNNIKFHAWINPFRVKSSTVPKEISDNSPFYKFEKDKFIYHKDGICFNPAYDDVQDIIINGVTEIAKKYNIDGIHFDDYFYPEPDYLTSEDIAFKSGQNENISLIDWRKNNISKFIKKIYQEVKAINPKIEFGISPPGNPEKCALAGIDVSKLSSDGYLDYICPQIYWSIKYKTMPFEKTALLWKDILKNSATKLYGGLALYKIGTDLDEGTWKNDKNILSKEVSILKDLEYKGILLYSWKYLNTKEEEIYKLISTLQLYT